MNAIESRAVKTIEEVLDHVTGFWRTAVLRAAFDLQVPQHVAAGRDDARGIAAAEHADERAVGVLLRALAGLGILDRGDGETYRLVPVVEMMLPAFGRMAPFWLNDQTWSMWGRLPEAVRTGAPVGQDDAYWLSFARGTRDIAQGQGMMARDLLGLKEGSRARVVDVGCGSGGVGFGLALTDPTIHVIGVDSEGVLELAAEFARELGLADRVDLRPTDVVAAADLGFAEYDVAILGNVLHLLDPDANRDLLAKVAQALVPGGRVLVNDIVADDERRDELWPLLFSVEMLLRTPGGGAYTFAEISSWLAEVGFADVEQQPMFGYVTAITATRS